MFRSVFDRTFKSGVLLNVYKRQYAFVRERRNPDSIISTLTSTKIITSADWEQVKSKIYNDWNTIKPSNIDAVVLTNCINYKHYDLAENYLEYLKKSETEYNLATIGKIFKLNFCRQNESNGNKSNGNNHETLYAMYEQLKGKYGTLDSITNEHVIMGLSGTDKWEVCKDILNEIKLTCVPNSIAYSCTVKAAFQHGQFDYAWNLLNEMLENNRKPNDMCYIAYIDKCMEDKNISVEKIFEFLGDNDLICDWELIQNLRKYFQENKFVKISQIGLCTGCKKVIPRIDLSDEEFDVLKSKIFERVIVGKDLFRNTSPSELELFQKLINKNIKYDVVIDGLNVAYSAGTKTSVFVNAHLLSSVVRYYIEQNKKVLVLGRTHMERWPKKYFDFIRAKAEVFLTQNISKDDPYLLYCALNAGPKAIIVSRDLMRSHVYLLKENHHKRLFTRWLTQSQHQLVKVLDNGNVIIKKPLPYVQTTQKVDGYWHLPYYTVENQESVNWMCLKLK